ncbi:RNA polymerase sigma-70 factor (ECF subfamily) [Marinicella litoralis]|uniref:RNA polymerase sigma-70 factor (ECF subfamily) n=2 Tax=Marinicella litoralis TaxID=644220 RepID=A0A4R6XML7_9GAMM|nr:RNA polymerase sigma-70 factor (ECF subfamily) [Marinicella litoralis]
MVMQTEKIYIEYLLIQAQMGESVALQKLMPLIQQKMLSYAKRIMQGSADAEDCVQDAMMVVLKKLAQLKDPKAFHGWMYRVINTRCQDHWRRSHANRHGHRVDDMDPQAAAFQTESGEVREQVMDIKKAMSQLPQIQQSVIYLFYFEGFKVAEVAKILEKPAGTIKSLLFDARAAIKSFLKQE